MAVFMAAGWVQAQSGGTLVWVQPAGSDFTWTDGAGGWTAGGLATNWNNANNYIADFGGKGATVTLGSDIVTWKIQRGFWAPLLTFDLQGYDLTFIGGQNKIQVNQANDGVVVSNGTIVFASNCQFAPQNATAYIDLNADISGSSNILTKVGPGILRLGGTNNIYGATTINTGSLVVQSGSSLGTTNVTLIGDAILTLETANAIADNATLALDALNLVNLDYIGTETVFSVTIQGETLPAGTYTAAELNALPFPDAFAGTGSLQILSGDALPDNFTYYIDAVGGSDLNSGTSESFPWATLARASDTNQVYNPGDQILLKRDQTHIGQLRLDAQGTLPQPIIIGEYGATNLPNPIIDGTGEGNAIKLIFPRHIIVQDLEITGAGMSVQAFWAGAPAGTTYENLVFRNLNINATTNAALAMITANLGGGVFSDTLIEGCTVSNVTGSGITINKWDLGNTNFHANVVIRDNTVVDCTGPGIQVGKLSGDSVIAGNSVSDTSGTWLWGSQNVVVENNLFEGSTGNTDATGVWLDIGNYGCIIQRNLSRNNEGGFVEILGNSSNNVYRYNISINDGARVSGVNGALQDGRMFWFGGYTGPTNPPAGPVNNYVYNNTIYTEASIVANYEAEDTADGALIANNVIYIDGSAATLSSLASDILFDNNLVYSNKVPGAPFTVTDTIDADPLFANTGGLAATNYIPANNAAVQDRGIEISALPGDAVGVPGGFTVFTDYFGSPVLAEPDMGAIEISPAGVLAGWHTFVPANAPLTNEAPDEVVSGFAANMGVDITVNIQGGGWKTTTEDGGATYGNAYAITNLTQPSSVRLATYGGAIATLDFVVSNNTDRLVGIASIHYDYKRNFATSNSVPTIILSHLEEASDLDPVPGGNYVIQQTPEVVFGWFTAQAVDTGLGEMTDRVLAPGEAAAFRLTVDGGGGDAQVDVDNIAIAGYISSQTQTVITVPPGNVAIQQIPAGSLLTWATVVGQDYTVETSPSLTTPSWDPDISGVPGTGGDVSVTSTVSGVEAFFRVSTP
jgi:autotransporter-associated beta strand protein